MCRFHPGRREVAEQISTKCLLCTAEAGKVTLTIVRYIVGFLPKSRDKSSKSSEEP